MPWREAVAFMFVWLIGVIAGIAVGAAISQQETCPVIGSHLLNNGTVLVVRECSDGTVVREYPWQE